MVIVNTGRRGIPVRLDSTWVDKRRRGGVRRVVVDHFTSTQVVVRNVKSRRLARINLQRFVAHFTHEVDA